MLKSLRYFSKRCTQLRLLRNFYQMPDATAAPPQLANANNIPLNNQHKFPLASNDRISPQNVQEIALKSRPETIFPLIAGLLDSNKILLAESLYRAILEYHDIDSVSHTGIANRFIHKYIQLNDQTSINRWKSKVFARQLVTPNITTFSILFKYHLNGGRLDIEFIRYLAEELQVDGLDMEADLLPLLDEGEAHQVSLILNIPIEPEYQNEENSKFISLDSIKHLLEKKDSADKCWDGEEGIVTTAPSTEPSNDTLDGAEGIRSVETKGQGIFYLKDSMKNLKEAIDIVTQRRKEEDKRGSLQQMQEELELSCYASSSKRSQMNLSHLQGLTRMPSFTHEVTQIFSEWQLALDKEIRETLANSTNLHEISPHQIRKGSGVLFAAILGSIESSKLALIILHIIGNPSEYHGFFHSTKIVNIASKVAKAVERELFAQQLQSMPELLESRILHTKEYNRIVHTPRLLSDKMRKEQALLHNNVEALRAGWIPKWDTELSFEIGVFLIWIACKSLKFKKDKCASYTPAFSHKIVFENGKRSGKLMVDPELFEKMSTFPTGVFVDPWALPMIVPPKPWTTFNSGGYLTQKNVCVRMKDDPAHLSLVHQAEKEEKLHDLYKGLDALGLTGWRINKPILKTAIALWNKGINVALNLQEEEAAAAAAINQKDKVPHKFIFRNRQEFPSQQEYVQFVRDSIEGREKKDQSHSIMCDTNYKLEIAQQFSEFPVFYLPHSVDFRGRAYPIPPHLSHIGGDLARGLLQWSEGKELGPDGLFWLQVQLANAFGFDKASLSDRVAFTQTHWADIADSADRPLDGKGWWKTADSPWQCLAACIELVAAKGCADPQTFKSHLPIQQDGSCNGLQHYAALGRDIDGAEKVNLSPSSRPQDVYAAVASLVNEQIEKDLLCDDSEKVRLATLLSGKINRKIVKQTVMTNVYGVTEFGARKQIEERLLEFKVVPKNEMKAVRTYLARKVFMSMGRLFESAEKIQKWFQDCAEEIGQSVPPELVPKFGSKLEKRQKPTQKNRSDNGNAKDNRFNADSRNGEEDSSTLSDNVDPVLRYPQTSVSWTTPFGFPVLQPYLKSSKIRLKTMLQSLTLRSHNQFDTVDVRKQVASMPPNFIHSLDASHMFKTALACYEENITFASVHDSFWTHASTCTRMNAILRQEFVNLHKRDILNELLAEFQSNYKGYMVPIDTPSPSFGNLEYMKVRRGWRPITFKPLPRLGRFDLDRVLESTYFFS